MQLGIAMTFAHRSPKEWAEKHRAAGPSAVVFPLDYHRTQTARFWLTSMIRNSFQANFRADFMFV